MSEETQKTIIRNRWSGNIIREVEGSLRDADLSGANLSGANLSDADLSGANLSGADLRDANLRDANLRDADLSDADLSDADLRGADLRGANLSDANLRGANLRGADLSGANLRGANLSRIRRDLFRVLDAAPKEVPGLLLALKEGRVNGSSYSGECACLVGTVANVRGVHYNTMIDLQPDSNRPAERWFLAIREGDIPEKSQPAAITVKWIEEWQAEQAAKVPAPTPAPAP